MQLFNPITKSLSLCLCLSLTAIGCASKPTNPTGKTIAIPNTHRVKMGDTVSKIAQEYNINWREISELNNLDANHTIYVGQLLKLPKGSRQITQTLTETRTTSALPVPVFAPKPQSASQVAPPQQPPETKPPLDTTPPIITANEVMQFDYPVSKDNKIIKGFGSPLKNGTTEGMFFAGKAGDPIYASGTGTVIYASNIPNHRPMIMIEHTNGYISTYLDVNEVQVRSGNKVNKGDKLGVMVSQTQSGQALFEFRIAKHGRYIDPITVLK